MLIRASTERWLVLPFLVTVLFLGVPAPATGADPPAAFEQVWNVVVPNHGGGAVATSERWTVIGGPQWGAPMEEYSPSFDLRDYVLVVAEPKGDLVATLTGSDTEPGDRFGYDVAIYGNRIAVGAPAADAERGAVYVFTLIGDSITEEKILPDADDGNGFGTAIDLYGTRLVAATSDGDAAVFDLRDGTWERSDLPAVGAENVLATPPDIAVDGDTVAIGRSGTEDDGVVDIYAETAQGWTTERLVAPEAADVFGYAGFGASVDIAGDCLIAGAPNTFVGAGYMGGAYVFCRSGTGWSESVLSVPEQTDDDGFGSAVALLGPYAVVSAPKHDTGGYNTGSVYVFARSGDSWDRVATLEAPAGYVRDEGSFGSAVDLARGRLVIGASGPPDLTAEGDVFGLDGPFEGWFWDDDGSVFAGDIEWLAEVGITRGCDPPANLRFCPDGYVTRGQMAALLVRALNLTDAGTTGFVDDDQSVFAAEIEKLAAAGITKGCNPPANTKYCPNDYVTRGQMAAFLVRAMGYSDDGGGDLFTDDDGSIFEIDIDRLATAGVTRGCNPPGNDRFCPNDYVTREQMAAFLHRALTPVLIIDGFEGYPAGSYPSAGGWYVEWSGSEAFVSNDYAYTGDQSFRLSGFGGWVRTDALALSPTRARSLTYEVAVFCPSGGLNCAELGFFVRTAPNESWMFNSFHFAEDHTIHVTGTGWRIGGPPGSGEMPTSATWDYDTWYLLRAEIDYTDNTVDFWLDNALLMADVPAAPIDASSTFALANRYGTNDGVVYFDDVRIEISNGY